MGFATPKLESSRWDVTGVVPYDGAYVLIGLLQYKKAVENGEKDPVKSAIFKDAPIFAVALAEAVDTLGAQHSRKAAEELLKKNCTALSGGLVPC